MTTRTFLYALWCLAIIAGAGAAAYYAWAPFADGSRSRGASFYGPTHK